MKKNNKGFTLAEMLIVVAIIGVLIAILVPSFTAQLTKAKVAASQANIRSVLAEANAEYLTGSGASVTKSATTTVDLTPEQVKAIGGVTYSGTENLTAGTVNITVSSNGQVVSK